MGYPRLPNQIGVSYGKLTIVSESEKINGKRHFLCECECGNVGVHRLEDIRAGKIKSCGCFNKEKEIKHGLSGTRIYNTWKSMISRCNDAKCDSFNSYGGRGIKVCEGWLDASTFYAWSIANGYEDDLTIERKNVNGNYEPGNCTWIPLREQANNTRRSRTITHNGQTMILKKWAKRLNIKYATLKNRLRLGWSIGKALESPLDTSRLKKGMQ